MILKLAPKVCLSHLHGLVASSKCAMGTVHFTKPNFCKMRSPLKIRYQRDYLQM